MENNYCKHCQKTYLDLLEKSKIFLIKSIDVIRILKKF